MEAKAIQCSHCGGPLELFAANAKTCVCPSCGAQLDLSSPDYAFLRVLKKDPVRAPLQVGMTGVHPSAGKIRVIGHLRFETVYPAWIWDEYLVIGDGGHQMWLQYDDGAFSIYTARRLRSPIHPDSAHGSIELDGVSFRVRERGEASIAYLNGELTWNATLQDKIKWLDAGNIGVEWTEKEIEVFDKRHVTAESVQTWFALEKDEFVSSCYRYDENDRLFYPNPKRQRNCCLAIIALAALAVAGLGIAKVLHKPYGYCETDADCATYSTRPRCNTEARQCNECLSESDCQGNQICDFRSTYSGGRMCTWADTDNDGTFPDRDRDDDNDGLPDEYELGAAVGLPPGLSGDRESNGIQDWQDVLHVDCEDSDRDGICDRPPAVLDPDGDGLANHLDVDADGDGIADRIEASRYLKERAGTFAEYGGRLDTDGDGSPDFLDLDSDNDSLPDMLETRDANSDGAPDLEPSGNDTKGDGIDDAFDRSCTPEMCSVAGQPPFFRHEPRDARSVHYDDDDLDGIPTLVEIELAGEQTDADGDGVLNWYDEDSDNDGTPDGREYTSELGSSGDLNESGTLDMFEAAFAPTDTDEDGVPDALECQETPCRDTDGDGIPDRSDKDDDNDGVLTALEGLLDPDEDGIPAFRDLDSDGDGIWDLWENDGPRLDEDRDGIADRQDDGDEDGLFDAYEGGVQLARNDEDGVPNQFDIDSDDDGILDAYEARGGYDETCLTEAGLTELVNSDTDNLPNFRDRDSDQDGIPDTREMWPSPPLESGDPNGDGLDESFAGMRGSLRDSDGDGIHDYIDYRSVPTYPAGGNYSSPNRYQSGYSRGSSGSSGYSYGK